MKKKTLTACFLTAVLGITACASSSSDATKESKEVASTMASSDNSDTESKAAPETTVSDNETAETGKADNENYGTLTGKTTWDVINDMGIGFNIGNSFDATGNDKVKYHETAWGNPVITQEFVNGVAAAGFKTVRLPVTWDSFIADDGKYTINAEYLARVKEVIDYCYSNDLYVIMNVHHDSWIENKNLVKERDKVAEELSAVWTQLAEYFAGYDQHLIFEAMNEPRLGGTDIEWTGNSEAFEVINYLDQVFVDTVLSVDKGHNSERCLMIPQYAASNSTSIVSKLSIPTYKGESVDNIIVSVHSYAPYNFCLGSQQKFDPEKSDDTSDMDKMFVTLKEQFLDNNIPVVIGETSATGKTDMNERVEWATYMGTKATQYGIPLVIWDNGVAGTTGSECHNYLDRYTGEQKSEAVIKAFMDTRANVSWREALKEEGSSEEGLVGASVLYTFDGIENIKTWDYTYIAFGSSPSYYVDGSSITLAYKGEGSVKMVVDSPELEQWWIPVDPTSVEEINGYHVAVFAAESIITEMKKFNVESVSQLGSMHFLVADGTCQAYEVGQKFDGTMIMYMAGGNVYYMGTDMPADPSLDGLEFLGWYTTKTYKAGTEFDLSGAKGIMNVYAKFRLK